MTKSSESRTKACCPCKSSEPLVAAWDNPRSPHRRGVPSVTRCAPGGRSARRKRPERSAEADGVCSQPQLAQTQASDLASQRPYRPRHAPAPGPVMPSRTGREAGVQPAVRGRSVQRRPQRLQPAPAGSNAGERPSEPAAVQAAACTGPRAGHAQPYRPSRVQRRRGLSKEWMISLDEVQRIKNEDLLPL
jgi:hypothetical protein